MHELPERVLKIGEDIKSMRIRGAGRIARAAAEALAIAAEEFRGKNPDEFVRYLSSIGRYLTATRPTAVSLPNAVSYVLSRVHNALRSGASLEELQHITISTSKQFIEYSLAAVERIGKIGARRIENGDTVLTHCNSSAAISIIAHAYKQGKTMRVFATETRPKFQGYITARQLAKEGIDVTLIPDSAVRLVMKRVDKVVVGADAVTANGAVINKVGTSQIALAAKEARVRVFVAAETYKFSPVTVLGELVVIEERDPSEVLNLEILRQYTLLKIRNPAFDVTPPSYIDAIVTELGVIPPQAAIMILKDFFGWAIQEYESRGFEESEPSA